MILFVIKEKQKGLGLLKEVAVVNFAQKAKTWLGQIRAPFLILSVMLVLIGGAVAAADGVFNGLRFALVMLGVTLSHIAVNLFNELSDHKTKIDHITQRTPFSGGSGTLQAGLTTLRAVTLVAYGASGVALTIGLYLAWAAGWTLLLFVLAGGFAARFYTSHLARWIMGELAAGLCLGTFVVLGTYYALASTLTTAVIWVSIAPGILTALLLLLNEFPDAEADRQGGRRHLVIVLGWKKAAVIYVAALAANYFLLIAGVLVGMLPPTVLLALLTTPLALKAGRIALQFEGDIKKIVRALGANVGVVLATDFLIAAGYFLA